MVRRNPAFRIASWGLTAAVMLCLVGAISLMSSPPAKGVVNSEPNPSQPIQVAINGDPSKLLVEHPRKPVPEPFEQSPIPELENGPLAAENTDEDQPGPWQPRPAEEMPQFVELPPPPEEDPVQLTANSTMNGIRSSIQITDLEADIALLKGQIGELARTQLEGQLAEIRHAEQLLTTHQSTRLIETLQREVDQLKSDRESSDQTSELPLEPAGTPPVPVIDPERHAGSPLASTPDDLPTEEPVASLPRIRFLETPDLPGRFDVDADHATLQEFLAMLGPVAGWNLVSGPELQGSVTCRWAKVDLQQALIQLLRAHGLRIRMDGEFAIVEPLIKQGSGAPGHAPRYPEAWNNSASPITLELEPDTTGLLPPQTSDGSSTGNSTLALRHQTAHARHPQFVTSTEQLPRVRPLNPNRLGQSEFAPPRRASPRSGHLEMKDFPELMAIASPRAIDQTSTTKQVEIEAMILQFRQIQGGPRDVYRQAITLAGRGPCLECGQTHSSTDVKVGHSADGWLQMDDGASCGVTPQSPKEIADKLKQLTTASVTATPPVIVLNRQLALIGLTEQLSFQRHIENHQIPGEEVNHLAESLQLSLRPTINIDGTIRLEVRPSSPNPIDRRETGSIHPPHSEFATSLRVPSGSCVVLGGLYFESVQPSGSVTPPTWNTKTAQMKEMYEVVVLISMKTVESDARPTHSEPLVSPTSEEHHMPGPVTPMD